MYDLKCPKCKKEMILNESEKRYETTCGHLYWINVEEFRNYHVTFDKKEYPLTPKECYKKEE